MGRSAVRGLAWLGGSLAWAAAAAIGAVLTIIFAASVAVIGLFAAVLVPLTLAAARARRTVSRPSEGDLLEARHVGGHSWVAYGWDGR